MKQRYPTSNVDLGYTFTHEQHSIADGFPKLLVFLRDVPTGIHFDPEAITLTTVDHGLPDEIVIHHPHPHHGELPVVTGRVILTDRKGKKVEFFTFGGTLTIEQKPQLTQCTLDSPAPILMLTEKEAAPALFAEDVEVILAERRASWIHDEDKFDRRLANTEPFTLFVVALDSLQRKIEVLPHHRSASFSHLLSFIQDEIKLLKQYNLWPTSVPSIEAIL